MAASKGTLKKLAGDPEMIVEISTGTEGFQAGEITLIVAGSGDVEVIHRRAGTENRYTESLSGPEIADFANAMAEAGFHKLAPEADRYVDEQAAVRLALRRGEKDVHRAELSQDERHESWELDSVLRDYEQLVARVTRGALPWGPAAQ